MTNKTHQNTKIAEIYKKDHQFPLSLTKFSPTSTLLFGSWKQFQPSNVIILATRLWHPEVFNKLFLRHFLGWRLSFLFYFNFRQNLVKHWQAEPLHNFNQDDDGDVGGGKSNQPFVWVCIELLLEEKIKMVEASQPRCTISMKR